MNHRRVGLMVRVAAGCLGAAVLVLAPWWACEDPRCSSSEPAGEASPSGANGESIAAGATHDDEDAYYLPFKAGTTVWVGQGYLGVLSHDGEYAVDFMTPQGTPIVAARGGTVVALNQDSDCNNWTPLGMSNADSSCRWNFVRIQHSDGTIAVYGHLLHNGVSVIVGQSVARGQVIASSGDTGFSFMPHLHFGVSNPPTPAHFADICGDGIPQAGSIYVSQNVPAGG